MIWPIILVFLSVPLLRQKIERKSFIALFISFIGVFIISSQGNLFKPGHSDIKGVFLATGSSVFWAFYFILNVKDKRDEGVKLFLNFCSVHLSYYCNIITGNAILKQDLKVLALSIYRGLRNGNYISSSGLKRFRWHPTTAKVSNLVYLAPFLSLIFVHFILHEPVYYTTPVGLVLIISGILIQNKRSKRDLIVICNNIIYTTI